MNQPGIIVIGAGRWGRNLVRCFDSLGLLVTVVDPDPEVRQSMAEQYQIPVFANEFALPKGVKARVAAAVIATPAETHTHVALHALEQGWDVFVEKPLALSVEDAEFLVLAAKQKNRLLMTGHLLLFHPAIHALKKLIDGGELGAIRYLYSNRLNLGRVRREENILWSFAPHDVATILHLVGQLPDTVEATGGSWLQSGIRDVTVTHLSFPKGQKAHVFVSWLHPFKEQKLVVVGSEKMAVFDDLRADAKLVVVDSRVDLGEGGAPLEIKGKERVVALSDDEPLMAECRHFVECCRHRRQPLTNGEHGLDVLRVLATAEQSLLAAPAPAAAPARTELRWREDEAEL